LVGAAEVYRVVDEPGLEPGVPQVGEDDDVAKGLADILEAWLEIEGGDVELYLAVDSEYDPINLPLEWPYDIRYLAYALLAPVPRYSAESRARIGSREAL